MPFCRSDFLFDEAINLVVHDDESVRRMREFLDPADIQCPNICCGQVDKWLELAGASKKIS
jgi:hypothetical protein